VSGLIQIGGAQMADRYTYLPLIGIFLMLTWETAERAAALASTPALAVTARTALALGAGLALAACAGETRRQLSYWQDSLTLFGRALELDPDNDVALNNYCMALFSQGKYDEAAARLTAALKTKPKLVPALLQLGIARSMQGRPDEALRAFSEAVRDAPNYAMAHNNLGHLLSLQGRNEEALRELQAAVRLQPDYEGALVNLANTCRKMGRTAEAIGYYREAIRVQPDSVDSLTSLAWLLGTCPDARFRNGAEATALATRACALTQYRHPLALATLAAACGEAGRFQEAAGYAEQAQGLLRDNQSALAARIEAMLEAFRAGRAWHEGGRKESF